MRIYYFFCWLLFLSLIVFWKFSDDYFSLFLFLNAFNLIVAYIIAFILLGYSYFFIEKREQLFISSIIMFIQPAMILVLAFIAE